MVSSNSNWSLLTMHNLTPPTMTKFRIQRLLPTQHVRNPSTLAFPSPCNRPELVEGLNAVGGTVLPVLRVGGEFGGQVGDGGFGERGARVGHVIRHVGVYIDRSPFGSERSKGTMSMSMSMSKLGVTDQGQFQGGKVGRWHSTDIGPRIVVRRISHRARSRY